MGGDRTGLQHLVRESEKECEHLAELGCTLSWIPDHATMDGKRLSLGEQNEEIVDTYFKERGWSVARLDSPDARTSASVLSGLMG